MLPAPLLAVGLATVASAVLELPIAYVDVPESLSSMVRLPLESIDQASPEIRLHLEHLDYVDHACLELIQEWERQCESLEGNVVLEWPELERRTEPPAPSTSPSIAA